MRDKLKGKNRILLVSLLIFMFLIWGQREIFTVNTGVGYRGLELVFTVFAFVTLGMMMYFLLIEKSSVVSNKILREYYMKLLVVQTVAFLPLYTQKFMYGDDLWGYSTDFDGLLSGGVYYSRPFTSFLSGFLVDTSFKSIISVRIFSGITLFLFGCVLFRFLVDETKNFKMAFAFSAVAISSCAAVDCIAYASVNPINASLLTSAISFVAYLESIRSEKRGKVFFLCVSAISIITAFCMYQVGTPIVFLMYIIHEKYNGEKAEKKKFGRAFSYLIFYGITAILYLLFTKAIQLMTGVIAGQSSRSAILLSIDSLIGKAVWFVTDVCPQSLKRIVAFVCGNGLFEQNNMFYQCTFSQKTLGMFLTIILLVLIIISITVTAYRKRSFVYLLISLIAIPLSFWPFLILPESTYLTYYAMGVVLLFAWYVCDGICILLDWIKEKNMYLREKILTAENVLLFIVIAVVALQSNNYAENSWVNYSRDSYEYLANAIAAKIDTDEEIDTIAVQGNISPYVGGREYVIFAVKDILIELGYDPDTYNVLQSDNSYYISIFNDNEVESMEKVLGNEKMNTLLTYYVHDDMYSRWCYAGNANNQEALEFLQECFISTGQLVLDGNNSISISMDGFNKRNSF